jgi:hypothetical protein
MDALFCEKDCQRALTVVRYRRPKIRIIEPRAIVK